MRTSYLVATALALGAGFAILSDEDKEVGDAVRAAKALIAVSGQSKSRLCARYDSDTRRSWAYVPQDRPGFCIKQMNPEQRKAVQTLLRSTLNDAGVEKVAHIRELEQVLFELENKNPTRDADLYYVTIFGDPTADGTWAWRFEGHHCSLSFAYRDGRLAATTPQFFGTNPAIVREGPKKGLHVQRLEQELARTLILNLTPDQRVQAVVSETAPADILTGAQRKAELPSLVGLPAHAMTDDQRKRLRELVEAYAGALKPAARAHRLARVEQGGWDSIRFAWMGSTKLGEPHYYRIQGAKFLIEYDNTQNGANHIHSVWRDFHEDFGPDPLAEHYRLQHAR